MSKFAGRHAFFRKISIYGQNIGFINLRCPCPSVDVKNRERRIWWKLDQSTVHGRAIEACSHAFSVSAPVPGLEIVKTYFVRTMMCALIGKHAHQTCLPLNISIAFWDRGSNA